MKLMNKEIIYDREMNIQRCYSTEYQGMKVKYIDHMGSDLCGYSQLVIDEIISYEESA